MAEEAVTSKSSSLGSVGTGLGMAVRGLRGQKGKRVLSGLFAGGNSFLRTLTRVLHLLFLQVTGFLFLVIAVLIGSKTVQEYHRYQAGQVAANRFYLALFFTGLFVYFGLSSFWRARK